MTIRPKVAETDVAKVVVAWLRNQHWDVHQEVAPGGGGSPRADIVGVQGRRLYVVEVKTAFSLAVVEQAMGWLRSAHYVSVAVPAWTVNGAGRGVISRVAKTLCSKAAYLDNRGRRAYVSRHNDQFEHK